MQRENKDRFLTRRLCYMLLDYAKKSHIDSGMIFVTRSGKALDRSNIWRNMKNCVKEPMYYGIRYFRIIFVICLPGSIMNRKKPG